MPDQILESAQTELDSINKLHSWPQGSRIFSRGKRGERSYVLFPDGSQIGLIRSMKKRRTALKQWMKKWAKTLSAAGFQICITTDVPNEPQYYIRAADDKMSDENEIDGNSDLEKLKKSSDHKSQRSRRLGKHPQQVKSEDGDS